MTLERTIKALVSSTLGMVSWKNPSVRRLVLGTLGRTIGSAIRENLDAETAKQAATLLVEGLAQGLGIDTGAESPE